MRLIVLISVIILILSCSCPNKVKEQNNKTQDTVLTVGPPVIIYKTHADYYDKVPVMLSEDKSKIISFPGRKDIYYDGKLSYPTRLNNGFLLDNRGNDEHVAFLNITYEQYSVLDSTPSPEELYEMVLDKDPITEMYRCSNITERFIIIYQQVPG